jgi:hypothetical protein
MERKTHDQAHTAALFGVSTYTVGDICGTAKHPDRIRNLYFFETAIKVIRNYEKNKGTKIRIENNPDTKLKPWDKVPSKE